MGDRATALNRPAPDLGHPGARRALADVDVLSRTVEEWEALIEQRLVEAELPQDSATSTLGPAEMVTAHFAAARVLLIELLAEFIVARAVGDPSAVRPAWATWDLTSAGGVRIEVKSAAYVQTWFQKKPSAVSFGVGKRRAWNPEDGTYETEPRRHADVYVFALLATLDQAIIDPLDLDQWEFYVVPTAFLDARTRSQHSITLATLRTVAQPVSWHELATAVGKATASGRPAQGD